MINQSEIAKQTGFSRQTVSLALNHPDKLDPQTLNTIREAIKRAGYVPNQAARNFQRGRTRIIAMVFRVFSRQDYANPFLHETLRGLHEAATAHQYGVRFEPVSSPLEVEELYRSKAFDGFIYMTYRPEEDKQFFLDLRVKKVPFVLFAREPDLPAVDLDYSQGAALALELLLSKGRERIAYLGGGLDQPFNQLKWDGFQAAWKKRGLPPGDLKAIHDCWSLESGMEAAQDLQNAGYTYNGVFCADGDHAALGFLRGAGKAGRRAPFDFSLLAGDGSYLCDLGEPKLSAIEAPYAERASAAVDQLIAQLDGVPASSPLLIPFRPRTGLSL